MRHRRRRGFTLIELVTVISILGIIGIVAAGTVLSHINLVRSRAAAARLEADIRYLQRLSLASGQRTWAVFNVAGNSYLLYLEDSANPGKAGRTAVTLPLSQSTDAVQFGTAPFTAVSISSVNINGTAELEFDSFGAPYDGNSAALTSNGVITLSNGVTATIRPVTGFIDRAG